MRQLRTRAAHTVAVKTYVPFLSGVIMQVLYYRHSVTFHPIPQPETSAAAPEQGLKLRALRLREVSQQRILRFRMHEQRLFDTLLPVQRQADERAALVVGIGNPPDKALLFEMVEPVRHRP